MRWTAVDAGGDHDTADPGDAPAGAEPTVDELGLQQRLGVTISGCAAAISSSRR